MSLTESFKNGVKSTIVGWIGDLLRGIPGIGDWLADRFQAWSESSGPGVGNAQVNGRDVTTAHTPRPETGPDLDPALAAD